MNRRLISSLLIVIMIAWSLMGVPLSAYADEGEAYIELSVTQAQPGMTIEIRGGGFEEGDTTTIMLMLVSSDRPQVLGTATADDHGNLTPQAVQLPADLVGGAYEVRVADSHHAATAALSIVTDSSDDEESSQRGEDEPLLAPMPTQGASTGHPSAAPSANTTSSLPTMETDPSIPITVLFSSALAIVILTAGLVVILRRFR